MSPLSSIFDKNPRAARKNCQTPKASRFWHSKFRCFWSLTNFASSSGIFLKIEDSGYIEAGSNFTTKKNDQKNIYKPRSITKSKYNKIFSGMLLRPNNIWWYWLCTYVHIFSSNFMKLLTENLKIQNCQYPFDAARLWRLALWRCAPLGPTLHCIDGFSSFDVLERRNSELSNWKEI